MSTIHDNSGKAISKTNPLPTTSGGFVRLSTEPRPTVEDDGVRDENSLLLIDTGEIFMFYKGEWRAL